MHSKNSKDEPSTFLKMGGQATQIHSNQKAKKN